MTNQQPAHIEPGSPPQAPYAPEYPAMQPVVPTVPGPNQSVGLVKVNIQGDAVTTRAVVPTLVLDGQTVASSYGSNAFQVSAGTHRVELYIVVGRPFGHAGLDVEVPPGGAVEVFYASPPTRFNPGSIGFTKQHAKGGGAVGAILALVMGLMVAMVAAATWFNHMAQTLH